VNAQNKTRVIFLGIDGLLPTAIEKTSTPNIDILIRDGVSTMNARSVRPTVSGPNWASMILGAGPTQHGVDNNGWKLSNARITPMVKDNKGYFPSVFQMLKKKNPDLRLSCIVDWMPILNYFNNQPLDTIINSKGITSLVDNIITEFIDKEADFIFTQVDDMDNAGHAMVYDSDKYCEILEHVDVEIGRLINALKKKSLYENTFIVLMSDHGGIYYNHGGNTMKEFNVPFIFRGPKVKENVVLTESVMTMDIAAIIANLFDCDIPDYWYGKPVYSAFGRKQHKEYSYLERPLIKSVTRDSLGSYIRCNAINAKDKITFTLNCKTPSLKSCAYSGDEVFVPYGETFKAKAFAKRARSSDSKYLLNVRKHKAFFKDIKFNTEYELSSKGIGDKTLVDGVVADKSFAADNWLKFGGNDISVVIDLGKKTQINTISSEFLECVYSLIFLPESCSIELSDNDIDYKEVFNQKYFSEKTNNYKLVKHSLKANVNKNSRFVKLRFKNARVAPQWHKLSGNKLSLYISEMFVN